MDSDLSSLLLTSIVKQWSLPLKRNWGKDQLFFFRGRVLIVTGLFGGRMEGKKTDSIIHVWYYQNESWIYVIFEKLHKGPNWPGEGMRAGWQSTRGGIRTLSTSLYQDGNMAGIGERKDCMVWSSRGGLQSLSNSCRPGPGTEDRASRMHANSKGEKKNKSLIVTWPRTGQFIEN